MVIPSQLRPQVLAALRACRLWRGADDAAVEEMASAARAQRASRDSLLAREGQPAKEFGIVVSGEVRVLHSTADGRTLTFETAKTGEPVGAVASLAGSRYPADLEAATDVVIAWLPREALFTLLERQPAVARDVIADLARRVVDFTAVATSLAMDVPARLSAYLFQRALSSGRTTGEGLRVDLGMTKTELASSLGTVPETLSRALARLRDEGVLEVHGRDVIVKDIGALARIGSGYEG